MLSAVLVMLAVLVLAFPVLANDAENEADKAKLCDKAYHLLIAERAIWAMRGTDENVKWRVAASANRLGVGTGDPDRSVGHEAASPTAQVALRRISDARLSWRHPYPLFCSVPWKALAQRRDVVDADLLGRGRCGCQWAMSA